MAADLGTFEVRRLLWHCRESHSTQGHQKHGQFWGCRILCSWLEGGQQIGYGECNFGDS